MTDQLIPTPPVAPPPQGLPSSAGPLSQFGQTTLQGADPNAQTSNQLATLMQSSSPLEQLAQSQGMNAAAARGSANGTLFAGASMAELNKNLTPIAMADAQQEAQRVAANQEAMNAQARTDTSAGATIGAAGISANASIHNADEAAQVQRESLAQSHSEFQTNWDNQFKMAQNSEAFQKASQQDQNAFTAKYNSFNNAVQTIFSDPSYWADPQAAMGMLNFYGSNIDDLLAKMGIK